MNLLTDLLQSTRRSNGGVNELVTHIFSRRPQTTQHRARLSAAQRESVPNFLQLLKQFDTVRTHRLLERHCPDILNNTMQNAVTADECDQRNNGIAAGAGHGQPENDSLCPR
ncbi:hypothetical protein SARC_13542, partial [Sphaeroforma arctica JP610]